MITTLSASCAAPALAWLRDLQGRIAHSNEAYGFGVDEKTNLLDHGHRHAAVTEVENLKKILQK